MTEEAPRMNVPDEEEELQYERPLSHLLLETNMDSRHADLYEGKEKEM